MKRIHVMATFDEVRHNLREFLAKQRRQFAFYMVRFWSEDLFCRAFRIRLIHIDDSFLHAHITPGLS
jgi:hypothetical protein